MTVDERRQRLLRKLEEVLGPDEARTLMDGLGAPGATPDDLMQELGGLEGRLRSEVETLEGRIDAKLELLETRIEKKLADLRADVLEKINEQTKTLFRTFVVSNAAMVLAVGTLAFGAARLA